MWSVGCIIISVKTTVYPWSTKYLCCLEWCVVIFSATDYHSCLSLETVALPWKPEPRAKLSIFCDLLFLFPGPPAFCNSSQSIVGRSWIVFVSYTAAAAAAFQTAHFWKKNILKTMFSDISPWVPHMQSSLSIHLASLEQLMIYFVDTNSEEF